MFLPVLMALLVQPPAPPPAGSQPMFFGEPQLRVNLQVLGQTFNRPTDRKIIDDYLNTLDQLRPVQEYELKIARHRELSVDLVIVDQTGTVPTILNQYDRIILLPSVMNLRCRNADVYYDTPELVAMYDWLDSLSRKDQPALGENLRQARIGAWQVRANAVVLSAWYTLIFSDTRRAAIVTTPNELPWYGDILAGYGFVPITLRPDGPPKRNR